MLCCRIMGSSAASKVAAVVPVMVGCSAADRLAAVVRVHALTIAAVVFGGARNSVVRASVRLPRWGMAVISTRLVRPGDEVAVAELHVASWRVGYRGVISDEVLGDEAFAETRRAGWRRMIVEGERYVADEEQEVWIAELDDRVVGFGHVGLADEANHVDDACGEIFGFYVHPDVWGSGVADALMERCFGHLEQRFERAVLWTMRDTPRSRRFYERHGWTCGVGDEELIEWWDGPVVNGRSILSDPVASIQYRHPLDR